MKRLMLWISTVIMAAVFLSSCSDSTKSKEANLPDEAVAAAQSTFSAYDLSNSTMEMQEMVKMDESGNFDSPILPQVRILKEFHRKSEYKRAYKLIAEIPNRGVTVDSIIFHEDWTEGDSAGYNEIRYDTETGIARFIMVQNQFPVNSLIDYDSLEFKMDLNLTLDDNSDDKVIGMYTYKNYKSTFIVDNVTASFEFTAWDEFGEPTAATGTETTNYNSPSTITQIVNSFTILSDESITLTQTVHYADGSSTTRSFTINSDGTGSYTETRPDGTKITGTFTVFKDGLSASSTVTVTFPEGRSVTKVVRTAEFTRSLAAPILNGTMHEYVYFANSTVDSATVTMNAQGMGDVTTVTITAVKSNGESGSITISDTEQATQVSGYWINELGQYATISAVGYSDGSSEIWLNLYASQTAFQNEEAPIATVHVFMNPDGTGSGEVTYNGNTYKVSYNGAGAITMTDPQNNSGTIGLW